MEKLARAKHSSLQAIVNYTHKKFYYIGTLANAIKNFSRNLQMLPIS
jgi:hypothetical protein